MLELDPNQAPSKPRDAASIVIVRDREGRDVIEVFCVQRSSKSKFMGGAIVFPGGVIAEADRERAWTSLATAPKPDGEDPIAESPEESRAIRVAACREVLEEAAFLFVTGQAGDDASIQALARRVRDDASALLAHIEQAGLLLDLGALVPLARWLTPTVEPRRYDTRFFLAAAPAGQTGQHDAYETTTSFWATPGEILGRFDRGEVQLAPPQHRILSTLSEIPTVDAAREFARRSSKRIIMPEMVQHKDADGETIALTLPGDPEHSVRDVRVEGPSRFVLKDGRLVPSAPPSRG